MSHGTPTVVGPLDVKPPRLLCLIAAHGLGDERSEDVPAVAEPLAKAEWAGLLRGVRQQRMTGLLLAAAADGVVPLTEEQVLEAQRECAAELTHHLLCERELLGVVGALHSAGFDHRVLKGTAVAHLDYPDPALRSFVDVDVLVRSEQWDDAMGELQRRGWRRQFLEPRPGFDRRFVKGMMLTKADTRVELDLHRTLALGPFGLCVRLDDLWQRYEPFELVEGQQLRALDREGRFLHACFHASLGDLPPRLVPLRDVAEIALSGRLDLDRVRSLATRWRAEAVVARAVQLAWTILGLGDAGEGSLSGLHDLHPPRRELQMLGAYLSPGRSYVRLTVAATRAVRRPSDKLRYIVALAAPKREFLAPRYGTRRRRISAAVRALRTGRGLT